MKNFSSFLQSLKGKNLLVLTHSGADVDGFSSAASLCIALQSKKFKTVLGIPEHLNLNAKALGKNLKIFYKINPNISQFDGIIMVDFNSFDMLGVLADEIKKFRKPIFLIDHHAPSNEKIALPKFSIIKEDFVSSAEMVLQLLKENKFEISPKIAELLASGIITDSANFLVANSFTFQAMSELMQKSRKSLGELIAFFNVKTDFSEKIAKLKAAKRAKIFRMDDFIAVITDVGAFEASAASALIRLGADLAFAGDEEKEEFRLSGRASNALVKKEKLDLAKDIFIPLEKFFPGSGGGHPGAAAFNGKGNLQKALIKCLELTKEHLEKNKNKKIFFKEYS